MATRITNNMVKAAYAVAMRVHDGQLSRAAGMKELQQRFSVNPSSAGDMIDNVSHMIKGERYERTNNQFATNYFLERICEDFGVETLSNAVSAVSKHLDYYEALPTGSKQPGARKILERFREITQQLSAFEAGKELTSEEQESFAHHRQVLQQSGEFDPTSEKDARQRIIAAVVRRQGQPAFRGRLLRLYGGRCAMSGCNVRSVLEAAHILPYKGPQTDYPSNGLLLRADLHTLFDLGLLAVETKTMTILVAQVLQGTCYQEYAMKPLALPKDQKGRPSREALDKHRQKSKHF
jgi:hypothetical protein